jgi:hypothetical protein
LTEDLRDLLASLCGQVIIAISLEKHIVDGSRSLLSIWLALGDRGIRLRTAPDGWGLAVESTPPAPADLGQHGRIEVVGAEGVPALRRGTIEAAWAVISAESRMPVGVSWSVDGSEAVMVYSYDDELLVGSDTSAELGPITYDRICGDA